jgi:2-dehydro-3-deoxyphosphogalactonate aldolase
MDLRTLLQLCPIISILRGIRPQEAAPICGELIEAGIRIAEVPLNSPEPLKSISLLARDFDEQILVGAGTVTRVEQVADVAAAGGRLVVMPHADPDIVRAAKQAGLIVVPGAFSPTEIFAMHSAGADAVKLFPAEVAGPAMLKALRAVLPAQAGIIAVGGIEASNARSWMQAGALGVGAGSSIYKPGDTALDVRQKARALVFSLVE